MVPDDIMPSQGVEEEDLGIVPGEDEQQDEGNEGNEGLEDEEGDYEE
jgi:hypothetical protein